MADVDPDTLLEWLQMGVGEERDMQLIALEQLCMLLLMSDNVDRCFEMCPPRSFLPALCKIFLDESAPENVLEVTARAVTYYLDVSAECTRRIVAVDGAIKAICNRLVCVNPDDRTSRDLSEQCVKVLEFICTREPGAVFEAGGLSSILAFICNCDKVIHKDTLHSSMAVVTRLCGKIELNSDTLPDSVQSLSLLLQSEDPYVSDGALRCFASLADRFTRKGLDPAPLNAHGLTFELIKRLSNCGSGSANPPSKSTTGSAGGNQSNTPDLKNNFGITTVIGLLSTLCRGSDSITHELLRSELPTAVEDAMKGDERCCLDTMRLCDLLLILLYEGREALPKHSNILFASGRNLTGGIRRLELFDGERSHRQLIDCIRSKETDALVDAVESGAYDVNFMDDVGQTMLNWASAFGTQEMVEFLCDRGADVNRGQRSSSLHYAACFGRPSVVKVLLLHNADCSLKDEEGKTALEKAKERNDEGHREVVKLLDNPEEWIQSDEANQRKQAKLDEKKANAEASKTKHDDRVNPKGDPEMIPVYLKKLLPLFLSKYQLAVSPAVSANALTLLRRATSYATSAQIAQAVEDRSDIVEGFADVVSTALDHEGDDDGHMAALEIIQALMSKSKILFVDVLTRDWITNKVQAISNQCEDKSDKMVSKEISVETGVVPASDGDKNVALKSDESIGDSKSGTTEDSVALSNNQASASIPDAPYIKTGVLYNWCDTWTLARGRDCLYLWSAAAAIELSNGSNGWFRYILDGKLSTMYSSGSPEGGSDSSESRSEFLEKLQRAYADVPQDDSKVPVLSKPGPTKILIGNWTLCCNKEEETRICNTDGQQATILKKGINGFMFESNRGTRHSFTPESLLTMDFVTGSVSRKVQAGQKSKEDEMREKIGKLALDLYDNYFKNISDAPRSVVAQLNGIVDMLDQSRGTRDVEHSAADAAQTYKNALTSLKTLLAEEKTLSPFDIYSSGLVQSLLSTLAEDKSIALNHRMRLKIFKESFLYSESSPVRLLVRKLISVLESIERLPVYLYDTPGSFTGSLHLICRRLKFVVERRGGKGLIDYSGRSLKMETMTTVQDLERHLLKMASKQWYDHDFNHHNYISKAREGSITFNYANDFDENGIVYWIGTNGRIAYEWTNPAQHGLIYITTSDGRSLPYGKLEDLLSRSASPMNCHTSDGGKSWISMDFGLWILPTAYTIRHSRGYNKSALRNWYFQGSKDGQNWTTLSSHTDDTSLNEPGSTATWPVVIQEGETKGWRHFRIQQNGKNASKQMSYLSISGFELYGTITAVCDDKPGSSHRKQRKLLKAQVSKQMVAGAKVVRGPDWKWKNQDGRSVGTINAPVSDGWVDVTWANGVTNLYRMGADGKYDLKLSPKDEGKRSANSPTSPLSTPGVISSLMKSNRLNRTSRHHRYEQFLANRRSTESSNASSNRSYRYALSHRLSNNSSRNDNGRNSRNRLRSDSGDASHDTQKPQRSVLSMVRAFRTAKDNKKSSSKSSAGKSESKAATPTSPTPEGSGSAPPNDVPRSGSGSSSSSYGAYEGDDFPYLEEDSSLDRDDKGLLDGRTCQLGSYKTKNKDSTAALVRRRIRKLMSEENLLALPATTVATSNSSPAETPLSRSTSETANDVDKPSDLSSFRDVWKSVVSSVASSSTESIRTDSLTDLDVLHMIVQRREQNSSPKDATETDLPPAEHPGQKSISLESVHEEGKKFSSRPSSGTSSSQRDVSSGSSSSNLLPSPGEPVSASVSVPNLSSSQEASQLMESFVRSMTRASAVLNVNNISNSEENNLNAQLDAPDVVVSNPLTTAQSVPNLSTPVTVTTGLPTSTTVSNSFLMKAFSSALSSGENESDFLRCLVADLPSLDSASAALLADLEDGNEDEENEDDDEFEDIMMQEYDNDVENNFALLGVERSMLNTKKNSSNSNASLRSWDDDFTVKHHLKALIPAFDPRPGRTNVQQTVDLEIPPPGTPESQLLSEKNRLSSSGSGKLKLYIKSHQSGIEMPLERNSTIFSCVQKLTIATGGSTKPDKLKKLWDPTYTIIYTDESDSNDTSEPDPSQWSLAYVTKYLGSEKLPKAKLMDFFQHNATEGFLQACNLQGSNKNVKRTTNCSQLIEAYKKYLSNPCYQYRSNSGLAILSCASQNPTNHDGSGESPGQGSTKMVDILQLLHTLHSLATQLGAADKTMDLSTDDFVSKKVTTKLHQQIEDYLCLACQALPEWCNCVVQKYPFLLPFEARQKYFSCVAFGASRSVVWLQSHTESQFDRAHGPRHSALAAAAVAAAVGRRDDSSIQDLVQLGRLRHDRVKVTREEEKFLEWAVNILTVHAHKKSVLEVEFIGEEGTGLGPTLEFYALVAAELQKKSLGIWLVDDNLIDNEQRAVDIGEGVKPPGYYVQRSCGLFPAPLPQGSSVQKASAIFRFLGSLLAKCLQDGRLVDLPLSSAFLKLMCYESSSVHDATMSRDRALSSFEQEVDKKKLDDSIDSLKDENFSLNPLPPSPPTYFFNVLNLRDLELIDPARYKLLSMLSDLCDERDIIESDLSLTPDERSQKVNDLMLDYNGTKCKVGDLGLTFEYSPSSFVYGYSTHPLVENGESIELTLDNAREYVDATLDFCLHSGIRKQMEALKEGFDRVFPKSYLLSFTPDELKLLLCGDQSPKWTREDILAYTEPKLGFTKESPGFLRFVNVICQLSSDERKSFLQFTTGCSSLPPGGLANLTPRLTVVRKVESGDGSYPSVNTCVHYLKLPDYSSEEILKERLLAATTEKGFHLN